GPQYDAWGIGISEVSKHKEEAWKLVTYLMSPEVNSKLVSLANAFPGNVHATPDFLSSDELLGKCFEMFQSKYLVNEFVGLPVAEELMRILMIEVQLMLDGKQTAEQAVAKAQAKWETEF
ncbi:MAG: sugar ABC transporter substrate-binding protein, partial [Dehalococcoidia bacterium]